MEFVKISSKAFTALVANKITTTSVLDKDENVL